MKIIPRRSRLMYETAFGRMLCADSLQYLATHVEPKSVDLILTSPPFPLVVPRSYGNKSEEEYIHWFMPFARLFHRVLKPTGSLVLDFGGVWKQGVPVRSIYQYKLLVKLCTPKLSSSKPQWHLAQEMFYINRTRLGGPWATKTRERVRDVVNTVWWLSPTPTPKADNMKVLVPYSESGIKAQHFNKRSLISRTDRAVGYSVGVKSFAKDNGGAIPPNILEIESLRIYNHDKPYIQACKQAKVNPHPARFQPFFAEFFIKLLTDEGDLVLDPFGGSNTTGYTAEMLKRRWLTIEKSPAEAKHSVFRFSNNIFYGTL